MRRDIRLGGVFDGIVKYVDDVVVPLKADAKAEPQARRGFIVSAAIEFIPLGVPFDRLKAASTQPAAEPEEDDDGSPS